jgi:hypothetical protein
MNPGGNITCNSPTYLYNKYTPGASGIGASSMSNRRAKNRLATVCRSGDGIERKNCFPCHSTLGQYSNYTHNPNGYYPCITLPAAISIPIPNPCPEKIITIASGFIFTTNAELEGLRGVTSIIGDLQIINFVGQPDFSVFDCLNTISGNFYIDNNTALINISGFNALKNVSGEIFIGYNELLKTISGFNSLITLTSQAFDISQNNALIGIYGFSLLTSATYLNINNNSILTIIPEFNALKIISNEFRISQNNELTNISGFNALTSIGEYFLIGGNDLLEGIYGFNSLKTTGEFFLIVNNSKLTNIPDFINLTSIGTNFLIGGNALLASIPVFNNLATVGGNFIINENEALLSITGFDNLATIVGIFYILGNTNLVSISGFSSIPLVGTNSNSLTIYQPLATICQITLTKLTTYFTGLESITVLATNPLC